MSEGGILPPTASAHASLLFCFRGLIKTFVHLSKFHDYFTDCRISDCHGRLCLSVTFLQNRGAGSKSKASLNPHPVTVGEHLDNGIRLPEASAGPRRGIQSGGGRRPSGFYRSTGLIHRGAQPVPVHSLKAATSSCRSAGPFSTCLDQLSPC